MNANPCSQLTSNRGLSETTGVDTQIQLHIRAAEAAFDLAVPTVGDEHYLNLGLAYEFGDHFAARFGINNLLDNDPPQMADSVLSNNTDTGLYDIFGRSYFLTLSAQF